MALSVEKVAQHINPVRRVRHFRVELHAKEWLGSMRHRCHRAGIRGCQHCKIAVRITDLIAMAHPHGGARRTAVHQSVTVVDIQMRASVFTTVRRAHFESQHVAAKLHAVANAQDRNTHLQHGGVAARRTFLKDARRTTRHDDALGTKATQYFDRRSRRHEQAMHPEFTNPTRDQLRKLAAEVKDQDGLGGVFHSEASNTTSG